MKKRLFSCLAACVLFCAGAVAQVYLIQRGSNTTLTYKDLKEAVDALEDGDRLYIPAGKHTFPSSYIWKGYNNDKSFISTLAITKRVAIYGAGYEDSGNATIIENGTFVVGRGADGTVITGIRFDCGVTFDNVSDCSVSRCQLYNTNFNGKGGNINLSECRLSGALGTTYPDLTTQMADKV